MAENPPLSERGAVRGLLQPLAEALAVLGNWNLRPPYVCGLDVWVDSPTAGSPGQAMIMGACGMGVQWAHTCVWVLMGVWKDAGQLVGAEMQGTQLEKVCANTLTARTMLQRDLPCCPCLPCAPGALRNPSFTA